jgi:hypothetical protein
VNFAGCTTIRATATPAADGSAEQQKATNNEPTVSVRNRRARTIAQSLREAGGSRSRGTIPPETFTDAGPSRAGRARTSATRRYEMFGLRAQWRPPAPLRPWPQAALPRPTLALEKPVCGAGLPRARLLPATESMSSRGRTNASSLIGHERSLGRARVVTSSLAQEHCEQALAIERQTIRNISLLPSARPVDAGWRARSPGGMRHRRGRRTGPWANGRLRLPALRS